MSFISCVFIGSILIPPLRPGSVLPTVTFLGIHLSGQSLDLIGLFFTASSAMSALIVSTDYWANESDLLSQSRRDERDRLRLALTCLQDILSNFAGPLILCIVACIFAARDTAAFWLYPQDLALVLELLACIALPIGIAEGGARATRILSVNREDDNSVKDDEQVSNSDHLPANGAYWRLGVMF
jgi:hypothetical protein